jgi:hypothetical protein
MAKLLISKKPLFIIFHRLRGGKKLKKFLVLTAMVISILFVLGGFLGTASAGFEPSPFRSALGKLGSIDNNLVEVEKNLGRVLADPPLDVIRPGWKGPGNKLVAISHHVSYLDLRLAAVLDTDQDPHHLIEMFEYLTDNILFRLNAIEVEMKDFISLYENKMEKMPEAFVDAFYEAFGLITEMEDRVLEYLGTTTTG